MLSCAEDIITNCDLNLSCANSGGQTYSSHVDAKQEVDPRQHERHGEDDARVKVGCPGVDAAGQ